MPVPIRPSRPPVTKSEWGPPLPPQPLDYPPPKLGIPRNLPDRPPEDARRAIHEQRIQVSAEEFVILMKNYIYDIFDALLDVIVLYWKGTAISLNKDSKTVTVVSDPVPQLDGTVLPGMTSQYSYGRSEWSEEEIVGKRVRTAYDTKRNIRWIDDVMN